MNEASSDSSVEVSDEAKDDFYAALLDDDPVDLYDRAPCGYLSTTPEGTIIKVNQTFLTLTGFERSGLVGRRAFSDLLTAGSRIYHETHYAPMLHMQGTAREIALEIVRRDGSRLPILVNSVLERDAAGNAVVIRTAVFDASDRREYERELLRAKERAEQAEIQARELVSTLQRTLIPPAPPEVDGLHVAAHYRPAGSGAEVGGDFYDVFALGPDDWMVVVGDVRGKGVEAAIVTSLARYSIRAAAVRLESPAEVLANLNEVLLSDATDRFCTAVVVRLRRRPEGWRAVISLGGHPYPYVVGPGGQVSVVGRAGSLLGVISEATFEEEVVDLGPDDVLFLYTDGVTEARRAAAFYGEDRLAGDLATWGGSAQRLAAGVLDEVVEYQDGVTRDDIVIVALQPT